MITSVEAKNHIGEQATVCGTVASAKFASSTRGQPTFLNLDKPYPNQIFTVVIWGRNRARFGRPEVEFQGKRICVAGTIKEYKGVPELEARSADQIKIAKE
jgi:DNA/RNA endonuclease YhcR with UshA esterase domain